MGYEVIDIRNRPSPGEELDIIVVDEEGRRYPLRIFRLRLEGDAWVGSYYMPVGSGNTIRKKASLTGVTDPPSSEAIRLTIEDWSSPKRRKVP